MGDPDTSLTLGKQGEAARTVVNAIEPLQEVLTTCSAALETEGVGLKGGPAVDLAQALAVWFETAGDLGIAFQGYAQRLLAVDTTMGGVETHVPRYLGSALDGPR